MCTGSDRRYGALSPSPRAAVPGAAPLLIVDDQRLNLFATVAVVSAVLPGRPILTADSVADAVASIDTLLHRPDIALAGAIVDVSLGDGDGASVRDALVVRGIVCPIAFYTALEIDEALRLRLLGSRCVGPQVLLSKDEPRRLQAWLLASVGAW